MRQEEGGPVRGVIAQVLGIPIQDLPQERPALVGPHRRTSRAGLIPKSRRVPSFAIPSHPPVDGIAVNAEFSGDVAHRDSLIRFE